MRLSELLEEARADAPPMRLDADQLVTAGRRRQHRRNTGWALAAVVAVATAIGVPQIVARTDSKPLPAAPAVTAVPSPEPASRFSFTATFQGYEVDGYRVDDPEAMALGWTASAVRKTGTDKVAAALTVFPPGADPFYALDGEKTEAEPVAGRRAFHMRDSVGNESLFWEYTDGGWAEVRPSTSAAPSRAAMRRVAAGLTVSRGGPVRTALRVSYLPSDYRLVSVSGLTAHLVPETSAEQILNSPDRGYPPRFGGDLVAVSVEPIPDGQSGSVTAEPVCEAEGRVCSGRVADTYKLVVSGGGIGLAEVRKVFESITVDDPDDPGAWNTVDESFPTFVRPAVG